MKRKWVLFLKEQIESKRRMNKQMIEELLKHIESMPDEIENEQGQTEGNYEKFQLEVQAMRYIKDLANVEEEIEMLEKVLEERTFEDDEKKED